MGDGRDHTSNDDSVSRALALLRIGPKLEVRCCEDLVLDLSPGGRSYWATPDSWATLCPLPEVGMVESDEEGHRSNIEADIVIEDFDFDAELDNHCEPCLVLEPPRSVRARRLMEARSLQCVICLTEKQHTLVPPHRPLTLSTGVGQEHAWQEREQARCWQQQVANHRFCTDCWSKFLSHQLDQQAKSSVKRHHLLSCPVCRGAIDIPDSWRVRFGMPVAGRKREQVPQTMVEMRSVEWLDTSGFWARKPEDFLEMHSFATPPPPFEVVLGLSEVQPVSRRPANQCNDSDDSDGGSGVLAFVLGLLRCCVPWLSSPRSSYTKPS